MPLLRPVVWVSLPAVLLGIAVALLAHENGIALAIAAATIGALLFGIFVERRLAAIINAIDTLADGDRYLVVPRLFGDGAIRRFYGALTRMRDALINADNLSVDQRRRETEAKLHHAGQEFFTKRFRAGIEEVVSVFHVAGESIRLTAADLSARNRDMEMQVSAAAEASARAARDVEEVAHAAREARELVARSGEQVGAAREATSRTVNELARANDTMSSLSDTAERIGAVVKLIQDIAGQTSLLALNATIESARAGEAGRGFAVVASEVKQLARRTEQATGEIGAQIREIQQAVEQTAQAITDVGSSVAAMNGINENLNGILERQSSQLDLIGNEAIAVAETVGRVLPGIRGIVAEVSESGEAVLRTAQDLLDRSQTLVTSVNGYFANLDHGAIKVGILHSLSGTLTGSERPLQQLLVMMIETLNREGGLLGRPVEAVIVDPRSDPSLYAKQADELLAVHKVAAIFGCWTSASRKAVLPVLQDRNGLLFYPSQYEGEELSPNVFYMGGTPRQQALPAADYLRGLGRRRFFLLGTDHVYPRTTNAILRNYLTANGVASSDIEECYTAFGETEWQKIVASIVAFGAAGDAAVITTVSGDANVHFFRALMNEGVKAGHLPVMSLSIGEAELPALESAKMAGHFVGWNYLHACDSPQNRDFIARWREFTGRPNATTNDPMEATWIGFRLWADAVTAAGSIDAAAVRQSLKGRSILGPSGFDVRIDLANQHLHKPAMIGRITSDGRIVPVWTTSQLQPPDPESQWLRPQSRAA